MAMARGLCNAAGMLLFGALYKNTLLRTDPYSPELNPVECLWQDIKQRIDSFDHQVRNSLRGLRHHVADIIKSYTNEQLQSLTGCDYIVQNVNAL